MFGATLDASPANHLIYRYSEDHKRPAPLVASMYEAHPELQFSLEYCDEFGSNGGRVRYADGTRSSERRIDPHGFDWIEWESDEDEDNDA